MQFLAGVDGCRDGWVVVRRATTGGPLAVEVVAHLRDVVADADLAVIAIDIPIGLPDAAVPGGRACDAEARRVLGPARRSSVFSAPVRAVLSARDHADAVARSRASSPHRLGLSRQCFLIRDKIAEVDALVRRGHPQRIVEVHPECSFAAMNAGVALAASKKSAAGRAQREALLARHWAPGVDLHAEVKRHRTARVAADDLLDAMAACWSAERVWRGQAERVPRNPEVDAHGLRMEICW